MRSDRLADSLFQIIERRPADPAPFNRLIRWFGPRDGDGGIGLVFEPFIRGTAGLVGVTVT